MKEANPAMKRPTAIKSHTILEGCKGSGGGGIGVMEGIAVGIAVVIEV
jgi:hypothetical protein